MSQFRAAGYWTARKESLDGCANRLQRFLNALSMCDGAFANWYRKGMSKHNAKQSAIDFTVTDHLVELLENGKHRRDNDKETIEDLGFCIGMWNGEKSPRMAGLTITCGQHETIPSLGGNCVLLNFPEDLGDLEQCDRMESVLAAVAKCWEPDWAGVFSLDAMDSRGFNTTTPFIDWMLYLSHRMWRTPQVAEPKTIRQINNIGFIIIVQSQPPRFDDAVHIRKVREAELEIGLN